jgi:hypothetical protein
MASFKGGAFHGNTGEHPRQEDAIGIIEESLDRNRTVLSDTSRSNWYDVDVSSYFLPLLKVRDAVGGVGSSGSLSLAMRKFKNSFSLIEN